MSPLNKHPSTAWSKMTDLGVWGNGASVPGITLGNKIYPARALGTQVELTFCYGGPERALPASVYGPNLDCLCVSTRIEA